MADLFIPQPRKQPAKVRDAAIEALVVKGAGAYNAKGGEVLFLPAALLEKERLLSELSGALLAEGGFQPVDCAGSDEAVFSLAERYVRQYGEEALRWAQERGRELLLYGWGASREEVLEILERAKAAIGRAVSVGFVSDAASSGYKTVRGVSPTGKGCEGALSGFKCGNCGADFLPDSAMAWQGAPVNVVAAEELLRDVHTPGAHTIPLLCEYLGIAAETTLKAMLYTLDTPHEGKKLLFAMIRGDLDISIPKLAAWVEANYPGAAFRRAEEAEIRAEFGEVAGFCGPVGVPAGVSMVADLSLVGGKNFAVGGNRPDYHRTGCCWGRDFAPPAADLALYSSGLPCPQCGGGLNETTFRELCELRCYEGAAAGEPVLNCRDREGERSWPQRLAGRISLEQLLLAIYENKYGGEADD